MTEPTLLSPRFVSLTLENFRGVHGRHTFDLDAPVVLFWGPNGTGKTTVFDGMLWLLQGSLPRLKSHALRMNDEYVVSAYGIKQPARVHAQIRAGATIFEVERTGNSVTSTLVLRDSGGTEWASVEADRELRSRLSNGALPLAELLATSGLLQQDDLRQILRDRPDARYKQLLRLLGLESLELFERFVDGEVKAARSASSAAKEAFDQIRARASETRDRIETVQSLSAMSAQEPAELQSLRNSLFAKPSVIQVRREVTALRELDALAADIAIALAASDTAAKIIRSLPSERPAIEGNLDDLNADCDAAEVRYREAVRSRDILNAKRDRLAASHDQLVSLIALAIPLLEAHSDSELTPCPVCETRVNVNATVSRLAERSESGSELAAADLELTMADERILEARALLNNARLSRESFASRLREQQGVDAQVDDLRRSLETLLQIEAFEIRQLDGRDATKMIEDLFVSGKKRLWLGNVMQEVASALAELSPVASSARHRAAVREDSIHRGGQLPQLQAAYAVVTSETEATRSVYDAARRHQTAAESFRVATAAATEAIFEERFESIEPLMNDIYSRLDPHPTFTKLDFAIERYRGRGTAMASVTDEDSDVQANPLLVFSAAQANVVVLSAFLALGWAAGRNGVPFVLMDDPLQSLDDVNVLGFSDLVGQLRSQKQVMLSTHEERFARLLERKLIMSPAGGATIIHRFLGWSREGPQVETRRSGPSVHSGIAS